MAARIFFGIFKFAVAVFAWLLIIVGIILTPSPIPFGIIFIAIGLALMVAVAPGPIRWMRRHWRWFDRKMHALEDRLPDFLAKPLRNSDYQHEDEEDDKAQGRDKSGA